MGNIDFIKYYKDLLIMPATKTPSSGGLGVRIKWLHQLGIELGFDCMRLYIYDDASGIMKARHIYGDKEVWQGFNLTKLKKESKKTVFNDLFFVTIRHIRDNGKFLFLGYLSFHTKQDVSSQLLDALEVLCILYGDYFVKGMIKGKLDRSNMLISKAYSVASSRQLPGTIIMRYIDYLKKLFSFHRGVYCTYCDGIAVPEYFTTNDNVSWFFKDPKPWVLDKPLIDKIVSTYDYVRCSLSELPYYIIRFFLYKDNRHAFDFETQIHPVYFDNELIGLWLINYTVYSPFNDSNIKDMLDSSYDLLTNSYKFLFQRRFKKMVVNPIFQNRDTRIKEDYVFVIMPFSEDWSNDIWNQVLTPAIKEIGMTPVRADDLYGRNIMEDVWQSILQASIIVCDTTGRNPNVFYELGIAHTLGKKVLLLTQNVDDIPFDLQAYRHILYENSISGGNKLKDDIKRFITETLKQN